MERIFRTDSQWVAGYTSRRRRSILISSAATLLGLTTAAIVNGYALLAVTFFATIYWYFEWKFEQPKGFGEMKVVLNSDGLLQSAPDPRSGAPIKYLTAWPNLEIGKIRRAGDEILAIQVVDTSLPSGVRSFWLEHYQDMDALLAEVESRKTPC